MFDVMYLLLADQGFSLPPAPHPSSEEEEVFDVSPQKKKKQTKFIIHITISFKNKASHSLQSFQTEHGKSCYHWVCKSNLDSFHFLASQVFQGVTQCWGVGVLLPKFGLKYNPAFSAPSLIDQRRTGRYSNHSQETSAPAAQYYQSTLQCFNSDLPKQLTLSKQPCAALLHGWAAAKHSVLGCWVQLRSGVCWPQAVQTGPDYFLDKIKHHFKAPHF